MNRALTHMEPETLTFCGHSKWKAEMGGSCDTCSALKRNVDSSPHFSVNHSNSLVIIKQQFLSISNISLIFLMFYSSFRFRILRFTKFGVPLFTFQIHEKVSPSTGLKGFRAAFTSSWQARKLLRYHCTIRDIRTSGLTFSSANLKRYFKFIHSISYQCFKN